MWAVFIWLRIAFFELTTEKAFKFDHFSNYQLLKNDFILWSSFVSQSVFIYHTFISVSHLLRHSDSVTVTVVWWYRSRRPKYCEHFLPITHPI
jgi:hypothetical protein